MNPLFSIITPMYNRQELVGRAIESVLAQDYGDYEMVIADDGSTDESCSVVSRYEDGRVRLIRSTDNQGRCPARNLAMLNAKGRWFVFLDSDDELLPGALSAIKRRVDAAPPSVGVARFMCRTPDGRISPDPPHDDSVRSYEEFLRWIELSMGGARQESLPCVRADTFPLIRYPEGHAEEALYHLDLAKHTDVLLASDVVRLYHQDAVNQVTRLDRKRLISWAPDSAKAVDDILTRHGAALQRSAPHLAMGFLAQRATWAFLSGRRRAGLSHAVAFGKQSGNWLRVFVTVALGLIGPRVFAWGKDLRGGLNR